MKNKTLILVVFALFALVVFGVYLKDGQAGQTDFLVYQGEEIDKKALYLFFSPTCPHCAKEKLFLEKIEEKYPDLSIHKYDVALKENITLLRKLAEIHGAEEYIGSVPLTFIGDTYFVGYGLDATTGEDIEGAIKTVFEEGTVVDTRKSFDIPFLGSVYQDDFSLSVLAILLGFLDGFNVCSLGALMLIIGLTLKLQQRKTIVILGGTFILTTALVYGGLIVLWFKMFEQFSQYIDFVKIFITLLALGGGVYFLKEYLRMQKQGAVCQFQESQFINNLMQRTGKVFEDNAKLLALLGTVLTFSAVLAVVEFPCSAATPLIFAGILADAGLSTFSYLLHIALFILFYMLDEIVVFAVAAYRLKLWMTSGTFTKYAVLTEALILLLIGLVYLNTVLGFVAPLKKFFGTLVGLA
jgi:thiol-disulfide isomerase/thioredoxin